MTYYEPQTPFVSNKPFHIFIWKYYSRHLHNLHKYFGTNEVCLFWTCVFQSTSRCVFVWERAGACFSKQVQSAQEFWVSEQLIWVWSISLAQCAHCKIKKKGIINGAQILRVTMATSEKREQHFCLQQNLMCSCKVTANKSLYLKRDTTASVKKTVSNEKHSCSS